MSCKVPAAQVTVNASGTFPLLGLFLPGMYYQHFISAATRVTLQADSAVSFILRSSEIADGGSGRGGGGATTRGEKHKATVRKRLSGVSQPVAVESRRLPEVFSISQEHWSCVAVIKIFFLLLMNGWMEEGCGLSAGWWSPVSGLSKSLRHNNTLNE